jgi:hypothetical protein
MFTAATRNPHGRGGEVAARARAIEAVSADRLAAMLGDPAVTATARVEAAELLLADRRRTPREARLAALEALNAVINDRRQPDALVVKAIRLVRAATGRAA